MPAPPPVILLPPSEGKAPGGSGGWDPASGRFGALEAARRVVAGALASAVDDPAVAASIAGVRGGALERACAANRTVVGGPVLPAWQRYTGVVWDHLDPAHLPAALRRRAASVVVVSAVAGLAGFDDPVPDYKLKVGGRLPGIGSLAAFWRPHLAAALAPVAAGATVWDLLPGEHVRALDLDAVGARRVLRVRFETPTGRAAGHDAKAVKGRFARHLLEVGAPARRAALADAVAGFAWPGWQARLDAGGDGVAVSQVRA